MNKPGQSVMPAKLPLRFAGFFVVGLISCIIGVMAILSSVNLLDSVWLGAFAVALTLLITTVVVSFYPHVFDVRMLQASGVFVVSYVAQILFSLPFVYRDFPNMTRGAFLFVATIGYVCTLGGIILTFRLIPYRSERVQTWLAAPVHATQQTRVFGVLLLLLCLALLAMYVLQVETLPIMQAFSGTSSTTELEMAREVALKLIVGRIRYVYGFLRTLLFPYTAILLLSIAFSSHRWRWKVLFAIATFGSIMLASATLEKSPVAALLIMFGLAWLVLRGRPITVKVMIMLGITGLIFPILVMLLVYNFDIGLSRIARAISSRVFYAPAEVLLFYINHIPDQAGFLVGRTMPILNKFFAAGPYPIAAKVCQEILPGTLESCTANSAYLGYLWADFSWIGVIVGGITTGIIIQAFQTLILSLPKSAPTVALHILLLYEVAMLPSISLFDSLLSVGGGFIDIVLLTLLLAYSTYPQSKRN